MYDEITKRYTRQCKYCGDALAGTDGPSVTGKALEHDGKLWLFCSLEHKLKWDTGRRTIEELEREHGY
jgi:hypothetical protein